MPILTKTKKYILSVKRKIHKALDPVAYAKSIGVKVGDNCRLINVSFGTEPYLISIGNHVSITNSSFVTHDGAVWVFRDKHPYVDVIAPVKVGDNVFIGSKCIILPGVKIGNNVIVGAGAVVAEDIPSNCVAAGVPAKPIKSIEEYFQNIKGKALKTKRMKLKEKKAFLLNHFGLDKQKYPPG